MLAHQLRMEARSPRAAYAFLGQPWVGGADGCLEHIVRRIAIGPRRTEGIPLNPLAKGVFCGLGFSVLDWGVAATYDISKALSSIPEAVEDFRRGRMLDVFQLVIVIDDEDREGE
ncbi:uncharacterized protein A4U43_C03F3700 [Asparagus officinalis]|uniref:Uncharacterized protein n=1 Tax=Asparagus officinalis TaxID=4686 RepID=A0A5P1F9U5_ASPOF|nr:uncharacterized protein A4U43_C03F3700 [Asparagus officinalis]